MRANDSSRILSRDFTNNERANTLRNSRNLIYRDIASRDMVRQRSPIRNCMRFYVDYFRLLGCAFQALTALTIACSKREQWRFQHIL